MIQKFACCSKRLLVILSLLACTNAIGQYNDLKEQRMQEIKSVLDTALFVNRMETVETPCFCIDTLDDFFAEAGRKVINSNYRIRLAKDSIIDTSGIECLSQFASRYMKLHIANLNDTDLTASGEVQLSYAYSSGSIMQYLGMAHAQHAGISFFFNKLIKNTGSFHLYPDGDKYRITIQFPDEPLKGYILTGYLEIVTNAYRTDALKIYRFHFDKMSIVKGDQDNVISVEFGNTSLNDEAEYLSVMVYHVVKYLNSTNKAKKAGATWLQNYFTKMNCPNLQYIWNMAQGYLKSDGFVLPNTEPMPFH